MHYLNASFIYPFFLFTRIARSECCWVKGCQCWAVLRAEPPFQPQPDLAKDLLDHMLRNRALMLSSRNAGDSQATVFSAPCGHSCSLLAGREYQTDAFPEDTQFFLPKSGGEACRTWVPWMQQGSTFPVPSPEPGALATATEARIGDKNPYTCPYLVL